MPMCAIYTAVAPGPTHELAMIARASDATQFQARRRTVERQAIAELVVAVVPPSHAEFARVIAQRDAWAFLTPAASRGNHAVALRDVHGDLAIPTPLWPCTTELACLVGVEPAHYIGNNLAMIPPELVEVAVVAFTAHEGHSDAATHFSRFLRTARDARHAVLLHWDFR
jgi:hypothetical protein